MDQVLARKIEANRKGYERLLEDSNYVHVRLTPINGALSAIHKDHNFDPTIGKFGIPRGDYEKISLDVLFENGKSIVLDSEVKNIGESAPEGLLDYVKFDIKGVEGTGRRNIISKITDAGHQGAETIVLYYHIPDVFNLPKITNAYKGYLNLSRTKTVKTVHYIVNGKLHSI